ncbi:MAG: 1,6-anhydro-N-acetylmuramyl-L-alanine amidase AmpD [Acidihalobacter sp.]|jgi:AmpD protein
MNVDCEGWLDAAQHRPSPNADERPDACVPELIVVHNISLPPGEFGGPWIDALFGNSLPADEHPYFSDIAGLKVSAHLLIRRDGTLVQYVPFLRRAWHAGISFYGMRERCNDFSIGIELEGADDVPYEDAQYERLASVIAALLTAYPTLSRERISGHSDIAPGRKTDPGPSFEWGRLRRELGRCLASRPLSPETLRIEPPCEDAS